MSKHNPSGEAPENTTPGRPTESGSRQQTHPGQTSQSGSAKFDREATQRGGHDPVPVKPPGAK